MKIVIELPDYPPAIYAPTWTSLQDLIRTCYITEREVTITRIVKEDGSVGYRGPGKYRFELNHDLNAVGLIEVGPALHEPGKS